MDSDAKMWISRYALTEGIYQRTGQVKGEYFCYGSALSTQFSVLMEIGKDAHATKDAAIAAAEAVRVKRLRSMERQMQKLRDLRF